VFSTGKLRPVSDTKGHSITGNVSREAAIGACEIGAVQIATLFAQLNNTSIQPRHV
jgi:hypothetical protein